MSAAAASHGPDPLAERIDAALPQTQCTRCGYPDCRRYAEAIAKGDAEINQCPPGGGEGIARLAALTARAAPPLNPANGVEEPRSVAIIDEAGCIGCTLCIQACPVDCIVGAPKAMHTVVESQCTGCALCLPACPVDCITWLPVSGGHTGWAAWSTQQADAARARYQFRTRRLATERRDNDERLAAKAVEKLSDLASHSRITDPQALARKLELIEAAMAHSRARRSADRP